MKRIVRLAQSGVLKRMHESIAGVLIMLCLWYISPQHIVFFILLAVLGIIMFVDEVRQWRNWYRIQS